MSLVGVGCDVSWPLALIMRSTLPYWVLTALTALFAHTWPALRRNRITESGTNSFVRELARLRIRVDRERKESAVLRLARAHRLSVYDASYLELALREAIPVATLDGQLAAAAIAEGTELIGATS